MKDEYIRKQDAIDAVNHALDRETLLFSFVRKVVISALKGLHVEDVVPVIHAYWIPQKENYEFKEAWMKCSACGYPVSKWTGNTNFCPNCGAKMDGKKRK